MMVTACAARPQGKIYLLYLTEGKTNKQTKTKQNPIRIKIDASATGFTGFYLGMFVSFMPSV